MGENPGLLFEKWKQSIQSNGKKENKVYRVTEKKKTKYTE
jgi:hypothetical protein